jgi:alpha-beta hydrolase superfamily lysophospholipase
LRQVEYPVIRRTESHFSGGGGRNLFRRAWLPAEPERLFVLAHGYAEHSGRYEHVGAWFAARGCAVHAYDHQGHGRSAGPRGHARRFSDMLDDLEIFLGQARAEHPGLPTFVIGHSMGGLVVAAFARERQPDVAGVVTSGAALQLDNAPAPFARLVMSLLRRVAPRLAIRQEIDPEALSRDPAVGRAYLEDPLVFQRVTLSLGGEMIDAARRTLAGAADVRVPMLLLHGEDDPLCPASASRAFYEGLSDERSQLRIYPGLRHEIFNEPEHPKVLEDVIDWTRGPVAGGSGTG